VELPDLDVQLAVVDDLSAVVVCVLAAYTQYVARAGRPPPQIGTICAQLIADKVLYILRGGLGGRARGILVMHSEADAMLIEYVAVHPRYHRRGLGRRLMLFAEKTARAAGLRELLLHTNELMADNIRFYKRLGYKEVGRRIDGGFGRVFMRKELAGPPAADTEDAARLA
jgi:ribosomal protein S18 acetylase RimI-like enzyme